MRPLSRWRTEEAKMEEEKEEVEMEEEKKAKGRRVAASRWLP